MGSLLASAACSCPGSGLEQGDGRVAADSARTQVGGWLLTGQGCISLTQHLVGTCGTWVWVGATSLTLSAPGSLCSHILLVVLLAWQAGGGKGKVWAHGGAGTQPSWAAAMQYSVEHLAQQLSLN